MNQQSDWENSELLHFSNLIHKFNFAMRNNLQIARDYDMGEAYTAIESHLVLDIEKRPGITVTELAKERSCSKSAITQAVNRLEKKGLVQRAKASDNQKASLLFVTPKGRTLTHNHISFDIKDAQELINHIKTKFSDDEIRTFFSIISYILRLDDTK